MTGLPPEIAAKIAERTGLDPRAGRRARAGVCRTCRGPILIGLDEERAAFEVKADPYPISALGEVLAIAQGRDTYTLDMGDVTLTIRDKWRIRAASAESVFVLAEHSCTHVRLPGRGVIPPARLAGNPPTADNAPF
jgi:hypothetical protein